MLYGFIALAVVVLTALLCYTVIMARRNSSDYLMNLILLTRYNKLLKKVCKMKHISSDGYRVAFENKHDFNDKDLLNNVEQIKKVDSNFALLKKCEKEKTLTIDSLSKLEVFALAEPEFKLEHKSCSISKVFDFAAQALPKKPFANEIAQIFGNIEGYCIEGYSLLLLKNKIVMVENNDVFHIESFGYDKLKVKIEKSDCHEVDYDGLYPLEELDFRQEEIPNDREEKGYEIITKVKCYVYKIEIEANSRKLKTKLHLMRTSDVEEFEKMIKTAL